MGRLQNHLLSMLLPPLLLRSFPFPFFLLLFTLLSPVQVVGLTVQPSNSSADLSWSGSLRFLLQSSQIPLPRPIPLAPLSRSWVQQTEFANLNITGTLIHVDASNSLLLQTSDIAFISCDASAYPGNLDASATVNNVLTAQQKPSAVLLYSTVASHCNYTDVGTSDSQKLFTLLSADTATYLSTGLNSANSNGSSYITANMTSVPRQSTMGTTNPDASQGSPVNSPNTAMIILYTITGIITALFLTIIITGAVRAHRHPERYGPRQRPGRPRQSRARGIARAMLETIPIVKFGDDEDGKHENDKGDIEMSMASEIPVTQTSEDQHPPMATGGTTAPDETQQDPANATAETNQGRQSPPARAESPAEHPNFSCPICTDDFVKGQDLRVLPCNHQFHPDCIDPWLVNVSGTCPLCRIDLNPPPPEPENEEETEGQTPQDERNDRPTEGASRHRRISTYLHSTLNARRMRDASVEERLAALRSVRENASSNPGENSSETDEHRRRHSRLSIRLRERFRIRTRAHGDETSHEEGSS